MIKIYDNQIKHSFTFINNHPQNRVAPKDTVLNG